MTLTEERNGHVEVDDGDQVEDLIAIATAHPVERKRLDLDRLNVREVLSVGDVLDMARELGTTPPHLVNVLEHDPEGMALEVLVVLAWVIGRKADPDLTLDHVRRYWLIEEPSVGVARPDPTLPAPATPTRRSSGRRGQSRKRA